MSDRKTTIREVEESTGALEAPVLPHLSVKFAARSEQSVRPANEDRYLVVRLDRTITPLATNVDPEDLKYVSAQSTWGLAVADGMGGHAAGDVASTMALSVALRLAQHGSRWYVGIGENEARDLVSRTERVIKQVDREIADHAEHTPACAGMGTTLTVAILYGNQAFLYHVGDSRAYLLRGGQLRRLTRDHTMAQELADAQLIASDEVDRHHTRHVLTQALGRGDVTVEVHQLQLEHGDRLLLATDGLTDGCSESEVGELLRAGDPQLACGALVDRALERGTRDNVTAVVADVELRPWE